MVVSPTTAELYLVNRRRAGLTQAEMAAYLGVTLGTYIARERIGRDGPPPRVGLDLEPYETCFLLRRRARMTQGALAEALELSVEYIRQMETGRAPAKHLIKYWSSCDLPTEC